MGSKTKPSKTGGNGEFQMGGCTLQMSGVKDETHGEKGSSTILG